jgi:glycosyltransferase involved in cell wall biosynthesis
MKLSIITVNLNNAKGLLKTIKSVYTQTYEEFEYILIDGGSEDGSINMIEKYTDKITYFTSESDNGIYEAMNKGVKKAKGEYCLFLNSGDWLVNDSVLEEAFCVFPDNIDIVYGNINVDGLVKKYPGYLSFNYFLFDSLPHPASFIKKSLFNQYGGYDEGLGIVSDWKFFWNLL